MIEQELYNVYLERMSDYKKWVARRFWRRWLEYVRWAWWGKAYCPKCERYTIWTRKEYKHFMTIQCPCGLLLVIEEGELYDISIEGL